MPVRPLIPTPVTLQAARLRKGGEYPSPCVNVCRMSSASGLCEGCWRTLDEIRDWGCLDDGQRKACWDRIEQRQKRSVVQA